MQLDWANDGKERRICQLTHPEKVHSYLREWPGLLECARRNPATLALYAPQLTIPEFDDGFADEFNELLAPERASSCDAFRYGRANTVDGNPPLCGDFVAWRHPTYGNYTAGELSYEFVHGQDALYSRRVFNGFQCLIWLLSDQSRWMPENLRETLKRGFRERVSWWVNEASDYRDDALSVVYDRPRNKFSYTRALRTSITELCVKALTELGTKEEVNHVVSRFIEGAFLEGFYEEQRIREARKMSK